MNAATESNQYVEDIVVALIGNSATGERVCDIPQQVENAREEIDQATAESFGVSLVESLCEDSSDLEVLEAMLVLGMAHPQSIRKHRIDLVAEAKRLATLLERASKSHQARHVLEALAEHMPEERSIDHELAGIMRRNGDVEELIERYLARADEAVAKRRPLDAVPWLQEVLLLDRNRRDVARMIRDLRYSEDERKKRSVKRNVVLGVVVMISMLISALVVRERDIYSELSLLPTTDSGELADLRGRFDGINAIVDNRRFWFGMYESMSELKVLEVEIAKLEDQLARDEREKQRLVKQRADLAEAARERGLMLARRGEFEAALRDLRHSLELTTDDWKHRQRVLADVAAIESHKAGQE